MYNMRYGFTMIELIFVIVIIGIVAAVAIPRFSATRDDAKDIELKMILKGCSEAILGSRIAKGSGDWSDFSICSDNITSTPQRLILIATDQDTYLLTVVLNSGETEQRTIKYKGSSMSL